METRMQDWRALSEAASREQDPKKLLQLVEELNRVLQHHELQSRESQSPELRFNDSPRPSRN